MPGDGARAVTASHAGRGGAVRRAFDACSLPLQIGIVGTVASLAMAGASWAWIAPRDAGVAVLAAASAVAATLLAAVAAARTTRALLQEAAAAHAMAQHESLPDVDMPLLEACREMQRASSNVRRLFAAARRRQRELMAQNEALAGRLQARTHQLTTLQDLSIGLATKSDLHELVDEALEALEETMEYASASMWARGERAEGGDVVLMGYRIGAGSEPPTADLTGMRLSRGNMQRYEQIERDQLPLIENHASQGLLSWLWSKVVDDARSSALYRASRSWMAVPLKARDYVLGVMRVDHHEPDYFDDERARLLAAVGSQAALAMRHAQLLARERDVAIVAERNRIARDLHDAVSQTLFAAGVIAGTLARVTQRETPPEVDHIATQAAVLERLTRGALAEMRLLMFELRPDALQGTPLAELLQHAIEGIACQGRIEIEHALADDDGFAAAVRVPLYRIAQEALSNVARHSDARHATVQWIVGPERAMLRVADDGRGFDAQAPRPGHFGVESMRSRAREIGASIAIASEEGGGTDIRIELTAVGSTADSAADADGTAIERAA